MSGGVDRTQHLGAPLGISGVDNDHSVAESAASACDRFRVINEQINPESWRVLHARGELGPTLALQAVPPFLVSRLVHHVSKGYPVGPEVEPDSGARSVGAGVNTDLMPRADQLTKQFCGADPQRFRAQRSLDASRCGRWQRPSADHKGVVQVEGDAHHRETSPRHDSFPGFSSSRGHHGGLLAGVRARLRRMRGSRRT